MNQNLKVRINTENSDFNAVCTEQTRIRFPLSSCILPARPIGFKYEIKSDESK